MRSGDLFIEVTSSKQALALASLKQLAHFDIQKIWQSKNVSQVRRITIRRDGQVLKTKHLILTFSTPDLPQTVKIAYIHCPVRPYIPNPLRCFQCQRFGHSKTVCRGQPTCARCGESGHDSADCTKKEKCLNCKVTPTNPEVIAKSKSIPPKTKVIAKPPSKSTTSGEKLSLKPDTKRFAERLKEKELVNGIKGQGKPQKISRDFHRKIEQDTLTGDCSKDDEA
ncbi:uncharacterized protein TNCV_4462811 [Trichonephila clavipes]|nr:uncharacterized protein TNCV_4462811 [Trichonephila clavipes]